MEGSRFTAGGSQDQGKGCMIDNELICCGQCLYGCYDIKEHVKDIFVNGDQNRSVNLHL
jgi:hypothetical protein